MKKNHFKMLLNVLYLFKLYSILIAVFLENNLSNICCEISTFGMRKMTAIWRALEITKDGKKVNILCMGDRNYERFVVLQDHFRNFKGIYSIVLTILKIEEYFIQGEEIIVRNWKNRGKLNTKKLFKITKIHQK